MRSVRRTLTAILTTALAAVLTAATLSAVAPTTAWAAGGPSVPLPGVNPTAVTEQRMGAPRGPDQASVGALNGDQPAGGTTKEGGGTSKATPLSASATWDVSAQTGDFSWSYPLRVPPSPGGLEPDLALSYASSAVDGHTSATNNQPSWIGDGWDLSAGFVERVYGACADDTTGGTTPPKVGDLCWRSDNAVASYGSSGGQLIRDDTTGDWRAKSDDGSRIERLTGASNGDADGEHWRITTADGTKYLFGSRSDAKSTWTVPVFGDDAGEPCHQATFDASRCEQAWRWNLDQVVDVHGNVIVYDYDVETNSYGANNKDAAVSYVRAGTLKSARYGLREGSADPETGRVDFTTADRCVPGSDCRADKKDNWPDVAWDDKCDTATCVDKHSPTFWSTKRLATITTKVRDGSGYSDVESWSLDQQYPKPGDGEKAALWLKGVNHTGLAGTAITLPPVTFEGTAMPNRVMRVDGFGPLLRYRVSGIVSETGGVTTVDYADPDCADGSLPANPETNTKRCFPMWWAKPDFTERRDYFQKYVVEQVTQSDRIVDGENLANPAQVTSYEYLDGAAWAYDTSEFTKEDKRTWNDFRGFGRVRIKQGGADGESGPVTMTEQRFHRGMNGDKLPVGTRSVTVADSEGGVRADDDWLRGFGFETRTHDGVGDTAVAKTISTPSVQGPTATRGALKSYFVRSGAVVGYTALASGGWRTTRQERTYDDRGQPVTSNDLGDTATAADDRCTRTTIVRNTDRWLLTAPSRTETVGVACTATPTFPADAIADTRYAYDGKAFGAAPDKGDTTRVEELDQRPASGPVYRLASTTGYDVLGRATSTGDALGRTTTTGYVPATGGPVTQAVVTDALGRATTTTVETAFGQALTVVDANERKTETAYDALGRTTEVWPPNRTRAPGVRGAQQFAYTYRNNGATVVSTTKIGPNGNYTTGNEIYDGLLRLRQTQTPASGGGKLVTDSRYDSQGRAYKSTVPYFVDAAVDDKLWVAADVDVPMRTITEYDGAGRAIATTNKGGTTEIRTTTRYDGDRVSVTPPKGGTATTTISDARGQVTELRQHHGPEPTGTYDATTYTYTRAGQVASVTDPAGSTWRRAYDLHGDQVEDVDPDKGTTTATYDALGRVLTTTDAKNTTLAHTYDEVGRKTSTRTGSATGPVLAEWTYDTALFGLGLPASATRYVGGAAYTTSVLGYNELDAPLGTEVVIPPSENALKGTYQTFAKYNPDGSTSGTSFPKIGDLRAESVSHVYDDLGKPTTTSGGIGNTADYVTDTQYTRYGEVQRVQLGGTGKRLWLSSYYDPTTRELERSIVDAELPQPMQADVHYTYDDSGTIKSISDTPIGQLADVQCFRYDFLQRVTEAWTPGNGCEKDPDTAALAGPAPYRQSFTYDKVGNRLTDTRYATGGNTVRTYAYPPSGGAHRLDSVTTTGPSGARTDTFTHDAKGNTTGRTPATGAQVFTWDAEGHLEKVVDGDKTTSFVYDADGTRLIRRDPTGTTLYLDGQELRLTKATGKLDPTRYYEHGGQTVALRDGKGVTWLANDHQSTAQVAVNSATLDVTRRRQLPFGEPRGGLVAFPGEKGFVGGTVDASTGTTHLGAREYDPQLGRFLSVDPVLDTSDPQQMQGYSYSNNSPITYSDPTGQLFGSFFNKVFKGVKAITNVVRGGMSWVQKNRSWIGVGLNVLSFIPVLAPATFLLSTALTAWDLYDAVEAGDGMSVAFDIAGLGLGFIGKGLANKAKSLIKNRDKWSPYDWKAMGRTKEDWDNVGLTGDGMPPMTGFVTNSVALEVGVAGAMSLDHRAELQTVRNATKGFVGPPAPRRSAWSGIPGLSKDPKVNSRCYGAASWMYPGCASFLKSHPSVNLGANKPKKVASGKTGKNGAPVMVADRSCEPNCYLSNDGTFHRQDGKGLGWS